MIVLMIYTDPGVLKLNHSSMDRRDLGGIGKVILVVGTSHWCNFEAWWLNIQVELSIVLFCLCGRFIS